MSYTIRIGGLFQSIRSTEYDAIKNEAKKLYGDSSSEWLEDLFRDDIINTLDLDVIDTIENREKIFNIVIHECGINQFYTLKLKLLLNCSICMLDLYENSQSMGNSNFVLKIGGVSEDISELIFGELKLWILSQPNLIRDRMIKCLVNERYIDIDSVVNFDLKMDLVREVFSRCELINFQRFKRKLIYTCMRSRKCPILTQ